MTVPVAHVEQSVMNPVQQALGQRAPVPQERPEVARRGVMLVLSSPSGAGKTTLSRRLLEHYRTLELSVSVTTRKPRRGEVDGTDYRVYRRCPFRRDGGGR